MRVDEKAVGHLPEKEALLMVVRAGKSTIALTNWPLAEA
jgi:hypothetical protein